MDNMGQRQQHYWSRMTAKCLPCAGPKCTYESPVLTQRNEYENINLVSQKVVKPEWEA